MGKNKLRKFKDMETIDFVFQYPFAVLKEQGFPLKGNWHKNFFNNDNPIVLELGCGKGEYAVGLARKFPDKNFIGIDIKGARMWTGASQARNEGLKNVAFLRTNIELLPNFFAAGEVAEIWITFPDPQLKTRRAKKRLTSPIFLEYYAQFLAADGWINLKTDSQHLYGYTNEVVRHFSLPCEASNNDIYGTGYADAELSVKTAYETKFLQRGLPITYTRFSLAGGKEFPMFEWEEDEKLEKDNEEARIGISKC